MTSRFIQTFIFIGVALSQANAQITLHADFDGASLDVAASTIDGAQVTLAPRATYTDPEVINYFRTVTFRAEGVAGKSPQFRLYHPPLRFDGNFSGHRFVYSTDGGEQWQFFDNNSGTIWDFNFSNNTPFDVDSVLVSWGIPYPVARARSLVEDIAAVSPHVHPSPSATDNYVLGYGAGGTDDLGREIPPQEILAFRISDDRIAASQKKKIIVVGGVHSGETNGNLTLDGFVRFAASSDPLAVELRERTEILVYPLVNPDGRYAGYWRSGPENPSLDYNRHWNDPAAFTDLSIVRNAMIADSGSDIDMLIDFHCHFRSNASHYIWVSNTARVGFLGELLGLRPGIGPVRDGALIPGNPPLEFLDAWSGHPDTLNADFFCTPEAGPNLTESEYDALGRDYAIALARSLDPADSDADGIPDHWELTHAENLETFGTDTDHDGDGRSDVSEWLEDTDPTNGDSFFRPRITVTASGNVEVRWSSHAGREYTVEGSASMRVDSWIALSASIPGNDSRMAVTIPLSSPSEGRQFFRIVTRVRQE